MAGAQTQLNLASFPGPPPFLLSVCVHNNTRERKTSVLRQLCTIVNVNGGGLGTRLI